MKSYQSRTGQLYQSLTTDVPAPLPDKKHIARIKYRITKEEHVKEQKRKHILEVPLHCIQCWFPLMMNHSTQRNAIPCCLSICGHTHLENQVGALPDQLNVCLLTNISIISQFVFEEVSFGTLSVVLFSLKGGVMLVRQKAPTQIIVE